MKFWEDNDLARLPMPETALRLERAAKVHRTVADDGSGSASEVVWHVWGDLNARDLPLVLFHGGSGSWMHWLRNIDDLVAAGRQVWAVDLPGFGDSPAPAFGGDANALVEPLYASLRELFGLQQVDLVGFSFGGLTAGLLTAAHPEIARQLVLVGAPAMGVVPEPQYQLKAWRHLPPEGQLEVHRFNLAELMIHDASLIDDDAMAVHVNNVIRDRMQRRRLARTDILAQSLVRVACPVHAIYGAKDALYKTWITALEGAYTKAAPTFRGIELIADGGHWVQFERPALFRNALLAALHDGANAGR